MVSVALKNRPKSGSPLHDASLTVGIRNSVTVPTIGNPKSDVSIANRNPHPAKKLINQGQLVALQGS